MSDIKGQFYKGNIGYSKYREMTILCYKGTILQCKYRKMTISYNSIVKFKKTFLETDHKWVISKSVLY